MVKELKQLTDIYIAIVCVWWWRCHKSEAVFSCSGS